MEQYCKCKNCKFLYKDYAHMYECRRKSCKMDSKGYACWPYIKDSKLDNGFGCFEGVEKIEDIEVLNE